MENPSIDAFILYNEKEKAVDKIAQELESNGISMHFWKRDIPLGEPWNEFEQQRLTIARNVLVFLGDSGWGPNHLRITKEAQKLNKRIIPILIGTPQEEEFEKANGLFRDRRYLDLREHDAASFKKLVEEIRTLETSSEERFDYIISVLVDGDETARSNTLTQIRISKSLDRSALAAQLRNEIQNRFSPDNEINFPSAVRPPKEISSIRSWMLSSLIQADAEADDSRALILRHINESSEPDVNVRYWTLAGLYFRQVSFLSEAIKVGLHDSQPAVSALAEAIASPDNPTVIERFREQLRSPNFEIIWIVLRTLRIVPIIELVIDVSDLLAQSKPGSNPAYDALYALSNTPMAREAVKRLRENPGIQRVLEHVIAAARSSNQNAGRNFTVLLAAFEDSEVDRALNEAERKPNNRDIIQRLRYYLNDYRQRNRPGNEMNEVLVAGYTSDTIDVNRDPLGIQEDVQTLCAVMLAKEVKPPLAIGLFGDWGTGKSYFMKSMKAAVDNLAGRSKDSNSKFCSNIAQIEFNAWHYVDTNLWASLVSHILTQLATYVTPKPTDEEQQAALLSELGSAKAIVAEAEAQRQSEQDIITEQQTELQKLQTERQQKEVKLTDLRMTDLKNILSSDRELEQKMENSLREIGVPAALRNFSDLSRVVSEAYMVRGRITTLFLALINNRLLLTILILMLLVIPALTYLAYRYLPMDNLMVQASAIIVQVGGFIGGVAVILNKAWGAAKTSLDNLESMKEKVDEIITEKRQNPTPEEVNLQNEIAALKAKEQEAAARVSTAAARVVELEERIRAINEGRSLARFLAERTSSEDYRKHLGIISTIRQDFESLATRMENAREKPEEGFRPVDRIILYIDDLDRCPSDKVMDVLQAVHLLLAYPLFVVVVGVDPRWLLHSLGTTYSAFQNSEAQTKPGMNVWRTTPQNYLEKIFQIPFNLNPMTSPGYGNLIDRLLSVSPAEEAGEISSTTKVPEISPTPTPASQPIAPTTSQETKRKTSDFEIAETDESTKTSFENTTKLDKEKPAFVVQEESLAIKEWEARFAKRLFALIPTPRAAKRFSNIYRILKARVRRSDIPQFEGTAEVPGEFQIPMLLLAMLISAPTESVVLFHELLKQAENGYNITKALENLQKTKFATPSGEAFIEKIKPIINDSAFPNTPNIYIDWIPRVSRFSFEVGRVVHSIPLPISASQEDKQKYS
ncbi:MAG TPA: P-loop NTPase fold protein [Pyrinomonadaceae bacterium]|jgi:hypothetical protein